MRVRVVVRVRVRYDSVARFVQQIMEDLCMEQ